RRPRRRRKRRLLNPRRRRLRLRRRPPRGLQIRRPKNRIRTEPRAKTRRRGEKPRKRVQFTLKFAALPLLLCSAGKCTWQHTRTSLTGDCQTRRTTIVVRIVSGGSR